MTSPTELRSPLNVSQQFEREPEYDAVADQVKILRECANASDPNPKQLQSLYHSTIMLCANLQKEEQAIELLNESENSMIFAGVPEKRATLFSSVILNLIANGSDAKGYGVYAKALSSGVWTGQADHQNRVKQKLIEVGFKL